MFKWLLLVPLIAFVDPFLLYWLWPHLHLWVQVVALIIYPLCASVFLRSRGVPEGDIITRPVRTIARIAAWYPGPISKFVSMFLITPRLERSIVAWATQTFQKHILRGIGSAIPGASGVMPTPPFQNTALPSDDNLKQARGRVVD